jgi:hypothetical protein
MIKAVIDSAWSSMARAYRANVAASLKEYGELFLGEGGGDGLESGAASSSDTDRSASCSISHACPRSPASSRAGLKYHDILIETPEVEKALARADPAVVASRLRRISRASDLLLKQNPLPPSVQEAVDPLDMYLKEPLRQVRAEEEERELLNGKFR